MPENMKRRNVPEKLLLGPGPTPVESRILAAMAEPTLGHLDRDFVKIMDETRYLLKRVFTTDNDLTVAMSGTGSAGMETACVNMIERRAWMKRFSCYNKIRRRKS
ncbi:MAG: hypothetical protein U9R40_01285 [Synergistota bacterium]|nr:hypothetical protein [Synergistota bacterium]